MNKNLAQLVVAMLLLLSVASTANARVFTDDTAGAMAEANDIVNQPGKQYCRMYLGTIMQIVSGTMALNNYKAFKQENPHRYTGVETCFASLLSKVETGEIGREAPATEYETRGEPAAKTYETAPNREARRSEVLARYYNRREAAGRTVSIRQGEIKGEFITTLFTSVDDVARYRDLVVNGRAEGLLAGRTSIRYYAQNCTKYPLAALVELAKTGTTSYMSLSDTQRMPGTHEFTTCFKELVEDVLKATGKNQLIITRGVVSGTQGELTIPVSVGYEPSRYSAACTQKYMLRWVEHCRQTNQCPAGMKAACSLS